MRSFRLIAVAAAATVAGGVGGIATAAPAGAEVAITAPLTVNLGSAPLGTKTISASLGTVTITGSAPGADFKAMVSATAFTTGSGGETIGLSSIRYWSGPATGVSGAHVKPGQRTPSHAVDLTEARTALAGNARGVATTVSWTPTLVIQIPEDAVAGTYTATITHSIA